MKIKGSPIILIVFCLCLTNKNFSQNKIYRGGKIEFTVNGKTKPLGKNVVVKYDDFFKSYYVNYTDINGFENTLIFEFESNSTYKCNGVQYTTIMEEIGLRWAKTGQGVIQFADLRKWNYGGTGQSYQISNLSIKVK